MGNVDAHVTAPAAQAVEPGQMVAIMGTSTCHVMNSDALAEVPGMCGVVDGGIVPGLWGYEAGQSGVGDIFGWFVETLRARRPTPTRRAPRGVGRARAAHRDGRPTSRSAAHGLVALDWHNGNRSVLVDHELVRPGRRPDPGDPAGGHLPGAASRRPRSAPARSSRRSRSPACRSTELRHRRRPDRRTRC